MTGNKPIHTIGYGPIRAAIFHSETDKGAFYDVTFSRIYQKDETWANSKFFSQKDLPTVLMLVLDAHSWIQSHKRYDLSAYSIGDKRDGTSENDPVEN